MRFDDDGMDMKGGMRVSGVMEKTDRNGQSIIRIVGRRPRSSRQERRSFHGCSDGRIRSIKGR